METESQRQTKYFCDFRTNLMEQLAGEFAQLRNNHLALNQVDFPGFIQQIVREGLARHAGDY